MANRQRKPMQFLVTLTPPPNTTAADMRNYVLAAVQVWKGQYHWEDPRFALDDTTVTVKHVAST